MKNLIYISLIILIFSCGKRNVDTEKTSKKAPQKVTLNTAEGYAVNQLTGDSVSPINDASGRIITTGKSIKTDGKVLLNDTLVEPEKKPFAGFIPFDKNPDLFYLSKDYIAIILPISQLPPHFPSQSDSIPPLVNSLGKRVKTGVRLLAKSKTVKYHPSLPVIAQSPQMKDNAEYNLQFLDVDQKLSSSYLNAILHDKKGNIWMGTWGGGVNKYDGKYFTSFTEKEGLSNNHIYSLFQDSKGNIWMGTYGGGVNMFDGHSIHHYTEKEGMSNNYIWAILEDSKGNMWFGTDGGGATKFDGKHFTHYTQKEGLSNNIVFSLLEDHEGNILMGTSGGGLNIFDGKSFKHIGEKQGLKGSSVWAIFEDKFENIWFSTGAGVASYDRENLTQYSEEDGLANDFVYSIKEDKNGELLFGTYGGGLSIFHQGTFQNISEENGLSNNYIKAICRDENGTIWLATDGGGVNKLKRHSFHHYTTNNGMADNYINVILEDSQKNIWLGTYGGISKWDGQTFSFLTTENGLKDNYVRTILEDSKGNTWIGTDQQGAVRYDGKNFTYFTKEQGLGVNTVYSIIEDDSGNIWFGTYGGGVVKFDGTYMTRFTIEEGLSSNNIYTLHEDRKGNIWIGTWGGGLSKYDGKNIVHYTEKEGLSDNHVNAVFDDELGNIWIGTNKGLNLFDGKSFTYFTEEDGLSNNVVYSITKDKKENLWLGTEKGLNCIGRINTRTKSEYGVRYTSLKEDGLKGIDFCLNAALIDHSNKAWFGSGKCLEKLDLDEFKTSDKTPEVSFHHLLLNERYIDYRHLPDSLQEVIQYTSVEKFENFPIGLELPYHLNHLTFHFTAIDWSAPHKLKYQYKLEGLDEAWSPLTEHDYADYRNIPYGQYTFKVRAIGEAQKWSKTYEYSFIIHPPWWQTIWFRFLLITAFVLLLFFIYRWRTATLRKRQKLLEKTVKERTAEVIHQKEIVEEKHKEITDSINYAKRLQQAILAPKEEIDAYLAENFLLYKPKDIVAGDFYFFETNGPYIFYAAADCTGHGVPGAMLSIVCANALSRSVKEFGLVDPGKILDKTRELILETFEKSKQDVKDGMDVSICVFKLADTKSNNGKNNLTYGSSLKFEEITWAGANNQLWYIENDEMKEIKADKQPIGKSDHAKPFSTHTLPLSLTTLFLFTDGYADQFGGPSGKKFKYANLQKLLLEHSKGDLQLMHQELEKVFTSWKNDLEQVDDVCIIGIRL